ncbi:MAG: peptidylprolyl isomerase [Prevotella sp.]
MKRTLFLLTLVVITSVTVHAQQTDTLRHEVLFETNKGNIRIALYNETPQHRDNFLKLVKERFYDGILFHRVIYKFMIQAGDSASRNAQPGQLLGDCPDGYIIPAEIRYPQYFHKRGAIAAARQPDKDNPERASAGTHFYIVYGKRFNDEMLDSVQQHIDKATDGKIKLTESIRETYKTKGGTPHLDGQYTVFGEVIEGMDVVNEIQMTDTDNNDRPLEDIRIMKATVIK